jgi:hypothetical protein
VKKIYKFIAGGSRVTPVGIAVAVAAALALRNVPGWPTAALYTGVLLVTLAASTTEPVQ